MKRLCFLVVASLFLKTVLVFSFDSVPSHKEPDHILRVKLTVDAPFSSAKIQIHDDGRLTYWASCPDLGIKEDRGEKYISQEKFTYLTGLIDKNNLQAFEGSCSEACPDDVSMYRVTVASIPSGVSPELADAATYTVHCYSPCPPEVLEIMNVIRELWGEEILEVGMEYLEQQKGFE